MTDPQRGAYTPQNEQSLAFDARAPVRGSRPVPMTLIVSAVVLVTLIVAIFLIYRGGVRGAGDAPQRGPRRRRSARRTARLRRAV